VVLEIPQGVEYVLEPFLVLLHEVGDVFFSGLLLMSEFPQFGPHLLHLRLQSGLLLLVICFNDQPHLSRPVLLNLDRNSEQLLEG